MESLQRAKGLFYDDLSQCRKFNVEFEFAYARWHQITMYQLKREQKCKFQIVKY